MKERYEHAASSLEGKVAVITGGTSGMARFEPRIADAAQSVIGHSSRQQQVDETAAAIETRAAKHCA